MKKKLLIGISCYNEEQNIEVLVRNLYAQKEKNFDLLVIDDKSLDQTYSILQNLAKEFNFKLIGNTKNQGLAFCQNTILSYGEFQYYLLLNADILPVNNNFITNLLHTATVQKSDLVSAPLIASKPENLLQNILEIAHNAKSKYFRLLHKGDNWLNFYGPVKMLSNSLAKKIHFPFSVSEDAYCFIFAKTKGFDYHLAQEGVYFVLPRSMADHLNQSNRAWHTTQLLQAEFGPTMHQYMKHDFVLMIKVFGNFFLHYPLQILLYLFISVFTFSRSRLENINPQKWQSVNSTKQIHV